MKYSLEEANNKKAVGSLLTAISYLNSKRQKNGKIVTMIKCICKCGIVKNISLSDFFYSTRSCGCLQASPYPSKLRSAYYNMISRCYNNQYSRFCDYGGNGVIVCLEWKNSMAVFCEWALKNGWQEGLQLDKDIKGNGLLYSPATCCFVTSKENIRAKKTFPRFNYQNQMLTMAEISEITGVLVATFSKRIKKQKQSVEIAAIPTDKSAWRSVVNYLNKLKMPEMETPEYKLKIEQIKEKIKLLQTA